MTPPPNLEGLTPPRGLAEGGEAMLPCPFCGSAPVLGSSTIPYDRAARILCRSCGVEIVRHDPFTETAARARALRAWNRRFDSPSHPGAIDPPAGNPTLEEK